MFTVKQFQADGKIATVGHTETASGAVQLCRKVEELWKEELNGAAFIVDHRGSVVGGSDGITKRDNCSRNFDESAGSVMTGREW